MSKVFETEFKGSPLLVLQKDDREAFPFQFGLRKAQLILAHLDDIRTFVQKYAK